LNSYLNFGYTCMFLIIWISIGFHNNNYYILLLFKTNI
jgi:hypothetical protein